MFSVLVILQLIAILLLISTLVYIFRGSSTYIQKLMMGFIIAEIVHNAGFLLELFARTKEEAMVAVKMEYLGGSVVATLFMMFITAYCGRKPKIWFERTLLLGGCAVILMVWTGSYHQLYYTNVEFLDTGIYPHIKLTYGPGFYFYFLMCTVIPWVVSVKTLVTSMLREKSSKRICKLSIVMGGTCFSLSVLVLYLFGLFWEGYDPTPIAMAIMITVLVFGVWNRKDFDLTRTATDTVLNSLGDGMITLGENGEVLMFNAVARQIFPMLDFAQKIDELEHFPKHILEEGREARFELAGKYYEGHLRVVKDYEQIIRGYTILLVDVTETQERIRELNEMREKAEEANQSKSNFLANMSHEIRTPMNAVVGMSELIIEECRGQKIYDYACDIKTAALNLLSIINDILDLSKVEAGKMELVEDEYFVQELVQDTVNLVRVVAEQKDLEFKVELDEDIPSKLRGDVGRIRQVLINILNNSIKFTKEGYVYLGGAGRYTDDEWLDLEFTVKDTGIGIKKEDLTLIFEAFRQLDMNRNRKTEGTGLGLAITKQLVSLMDGDIQVQSEYGKGTTFVIHIRQKVTDKRTIRENPLKRTGVEENKTQEFNGAEYQVLVVDDNAINRKLAVAMLRAYGFQISQADSGKAAIDMVRKQRYDIIFMDHMMPEMDGMEATKIIREECQETAEGTIIVALTANAIQGAQEMYLENGFDAFLSKPFDRAQMNEMLKRWIKGVEEN